MNAQELHDLWEPVWEKCPELRPEGYFVSDGLFQSGGSTIGIDDAEARINWTAMMWLAKSGQEPRISEEAKGFIVEIVGGHLMNEVEFYGDTPVQALNAAVQVVLEM